MLSIQKITAFVNDCVTFRQKTTFYTTSSGLFSTRALVRPSGRISPAAVSGDLGQRGACQLIHQHREQHHVAHHVAVRELGGCGSHAQCHTGLRQQGDAEVLLDSITAAGPRSAKGKNEKGKRSAARKDAYTSSILSAQTKSNRNMEPRQRAPVGQIKETPSVIAARCHPFPFWHFRATSPGRGSLSHGGRLWREGEVFHSAKGSLFEGAGTA